MKEKKVIVPNGPDSPCALGEFPSANTYFFHNFIFIL